MAFHIEKRMAGLPDILRTYNWQVLIPGINSLPGLANIMTQEDLMLRARAVAIPQRGIDKIESNFMAMKQYFPGRVNFSGNVSITFEELEDQKVLRAMNAWANVLVDTNIATGGAGLGTTKRAVSRDIFVQPSKFNGTKTDFCVKLYNCFPESMSDVSLSYDNSDKVSIDMTFSYDFWTIEPGRDLI